MPGPYPSVTRVTGLSIHTGRINVKLGRALYALARALNDAGAVRLDGALDAPAAGSIDGALLYMTTSLPRSRLEFGIDQHGAAGSGAIRLAPGTPSDALASLEPQADA
jgi:hypothetical protein